jgi:hypothetical protein
MHSLPIGYTTAVMLILFKQTAELTGIYGEYIKLGSLKKSGY